MKAKTYAGIPLLDRDGEIRAWALVDIADVSWLSQWNWSLHSMGYAARGERVARRNRLVLMHRAILDLEAGDRRQADHINLNRLDNRRENLRIVALAENRQNTRARPGSSSRYRGVCWDKRAGKWMARARLDTRERFIGYYDDEDEAGAAAAAWRREHMPFSAEAAA